MYSLTAIVVCASAFFTQIEPAWVIEENGTNATQGQKIREINDYQRKFDNFCQRLIFNYARTLLTTFKHKNKQIVTGHSQKKKYSKIRVERYLQRIMLNQARLFSQSFSWKQNVVKDRIPCFPPRICYLK